MYCNSVASNCSLNKVYFSFDVAILYNNLGMAWDALGEYQKAIEFYNKALAIFMDFFGPDHPSTKTVAGNIEYVQQ